MEKNIKYLWKLAKGYRIYYFSMLFFLVFEVLLCFLMPLILSELINQIVYYRNVKTFVMIASTYLILLIGYTTNYFWRMMLYQAIENRFINKIKVDLFYKITNSTSNNLINIKSGDLVETIDRDSEQIHSSIIHGFYIRSISDGFGVILIMTIVMLINYKIGLLITLLSSLSIYVSQKANKDIYFLNESNRNQYTSYISWLYEVIKGIEDIRLFSGRKWVITKFLKYNKTFIKNEVKLEQKKIIVTKLNDFLSLLCNIAFYIICAFLIKNKEISIGYFFTFTIYYAQVNSFMSNLIERLYMFQKGKVSAEKVNSLCRLPVENGERKKDLVINKGNIQFRNVSFSYNSNRYILRNVSFDIFARTKIGIVGDSGEGKSTLAYLLAAFYHPLTGEIIVDGNDIGQYSTKSIRENISIVGQTPVVFNGTIRFNLCLGNPFITDEQIWAMCEKVRLVKVIESLPKGLDTIIGKNGISLSGGQYQRLNIGRVLLRNTPIIIFDEVTSSLDKHTEKFILNCIESLKDNHTIILISHRLYTLVDCDKIIIMKGGKKIAEGTHNEMIRECHHYKKLYRQQRTRING